MKTKLLIETNPYLIDPHKREELITRSVKTSGGVEGIKTSGGSNSKIIQIPRRKEKKIHNRIKQTVAAK